MAEDERSIYIGQVDYSTTPEELATFFQSCGKVARVTIPGYQHGTPQGYAYLEFEALEGVAASLASMNGASFKGRDLKVKNNTATTQKLVAGGDV